MLSHFLHSALPVLTAWLLLAHSIYASAGGVEETWPAKPITLVIPFPSGGGLDAVGRIVADKLSKELRQTIVVSNRPGANGSIASNAVARAKPDGYTLILTSIGTHAINPLINPHVTYDPLSDFTHISMIAHTANVLIASSSFLGKTIQDVVTQSKDRPLSFAITGYGSSNHVAQVLFEQAAHVQFNEILYKGDAAALNDMLSGEVQLMFVNYFTALPHIKANRLRALAVTATTRSDLLPHIPTMKEAGIDVVVDAWVGLAAPANLPAPIVERLNTLTNKVLQNQEMQDRLTARGTSIMASSSQEATTFITMEIAKWTNVVRDAKIVVK